MKLRRGTDRHEPIAIVGMAGRFPGARDVRQLWSNICAGVESVRFPCEGELIASGVTRQTLSNPAHVPASAAADDLDRFDAAFFSVGAREAELMDPQLRIALETAWEALEDAGLDPSRDGTNIGLFMGASLSSYLCHNLLPNQNLLERAGGAERLLILNDKDFYPTTISYRLNLRGPSISVGTACSSSLVAVHLACQSLLADECRTAIAGGSSVHVPLGRGYFHTKEGIYSPDGHCRPFDADARGTVGGDGAAFVVLKRYRDAIRDRDHICALIRGSAVNNDGAAKAGYAAPSVEAQSAVIQQALKQAWVSAREIGWVEAHGTGTILGDPVEVAALSDAFRKQTSARGYCALGSLKANIGHLDTAAGVAGLIKAACIVRDGILPPAVNFSGPNPHIDFAGSPFFVNTALRPWPRNLRPRRAGVSAFGVGGTNAHIILQQAPRRRPRRDVGGPWIFPVSAQSEGALHAAVNRLEQCLHECQDEAGSLADVEITLASGRKQFPLRRALVVATRGEVRHQTVTADHRPSASVPRLLFFAPPAYTLDKELGCELFASRPDFRNSVVLCLDALEDRQCASHTLSSFDRKAARGDERSSAAGCAVRAFAFQYALARMLMEWGAKPEQILGLEVGELVAANLSESLSLADAVSAAQRLQQGTTGDRAMIVKLSERDLAAMLPRGISIVAVCAPEACVIGGPSSTIASLYPLFLRSGVACRWLKYQFPRDWQTAHPRAIQLHEAFRSVAGEPGIWLELGSGRMLPGLLRRNQLTQAMRLPGLMIGPEPSERRRVLQWLGALWEQGLEVNWEHFLEGRGGQRCSLPTYPFQSQRYWIEAPGVAAVTPVKTPGERRSGLKRLEQAVLRRQGTPRLMPSELRQELDKLAVGIITEYLSTQGIREGTSWEFPALADHLGVLPKFHRGLRYYIDVLRQEGLAFSQQDRLQFANFRSARPPVVGHCLTLRGEFPEFRGLIDFIEHCASHLAESLSTQHGGLRTLYPDGSDTLIRKFLNNTVSYGTLPLCVELLCRWVAEQWLPSLQRKSRILEVGMGGGIVTWNLAPMLRGTQVEYVATDITRAMLSAGEQRARREKISGMVFQPYDLRRAPSDQGLQPSSFDLILALDVLHIVPRLTETLTHLRQLLAPDGMLGIVESTNRDRWPNLVWGLSEEWWAFEDREDTPLMSAERWASSLKATGFGEVTIGPTGGYEQTDCALLLCDAGPAAETAPVGLTRSRVEALPKRPDIDTWFYTPVWRPWTATATPSPLSKQRWLFFANDDMTARSVEQALRDANNEVVVVRQHPIYVRLGPRDYRIRVDRAGDYTALAESVLREGRLDGILHGWTLKPAPLDALSRLDLEQADGIHSLLFTMQALGRLNVTAPLRLGILTNNTDEVTGGDLLNPVQATLKGAAKIIPQEYPNVRCVHLDLDLRTPLGDDELQRIVTVLQGEMPERFLACRNQRLFRLEVERACALEPGANLPLKERGVYLITGGLGGVGLTLAEYLAKQTAARLVLVGRTGLPPRAEWPRLASQDSSVGSQVRGIQQLEALGAEVLILAADLSDRRRMEQVVKEAEERFGTIQGVIHTAAVADTAGAIQRRSRSATERALAAKVRGTLVLDSLLRDRPLDFFVLCSALGATIYNLKFGEVGYVAANDFLNAYSHYLRTSRGVPSITINWTDWEDVGMAADALKRLGQAREDLEEVEHPFWERRQRIGGRARFSAAVHAGAQWVFYGHRIGGRLTLPGTAMIDLIASAFQMKEVAAGCEIRNLYVLSPVVVADWERAELALTLQASKDGSRCDLTLTREDSEESEHASGWIKPLDLATRPPSLSIAAVQSRCDQSVTFAAGERRSGAAGIVLDARWDSVREVWLGRSEGLARLEFGEDVKDELHAFQWHPALLDSAVAFLNHAIISEPGALYLPVGYERVRLWAPLETIIYSYGRWQETIDNRGKSLRFDFTIADAEGRVLVEIDGLMARRVSAVAGLSSESQPNHRLEIGRPGFLKTLGFRKVAAPEPPSEHVEIEVMAAGLNFKEVLTALGLMGGEPTLGMECSGRVRRVGTGVSRFKPGDHVIAFGFRWTMPLACVPELWLEAMPESLGFEEAATMPVAFVVAYHGLINLARLQAGELVLIHSACGGVGLAALQIARRAGAKIIATAGTENKRAYLRQIGIEQVSDSRSAAFLQDTLEWTGGRGADVVLNSLQGELLDKGLEALAPRGRFVELGRRDFQENHRIDLRLLAKGVQFLPVLPDPQDTEFVAAWRDVCQLIREGELTPLPFQSFPTNRISEAFDQMSRGEHIGKLVVVPDGTYPPVSKNIQARELGETDAVVLSLVQGMTPTEGVDAFRRALAAGLPEIFVSTQDLNAMLKQQEIVSTGGHEAFWNARRPAAESEAATREGISNPEPDKNPDKNNKDKDMDRNMDVGAGLATIWRDLLGVAAIAPEADFFDLGGDSLVAIRMLARMKDIFGVEQTLAGLFEAPTFQQVCDSIRSARAQPVSVQ